MSYEEIDRSAYGNDVFTNGAEGRYAKPKEKSQKKQRAPKVPDNDPVEQAEEGVKTKKKSRKTVDDGVIHNDGDAAQIVSSADGETAVKPKKKRAPKIESNNENIDPIPPGDEAPVKKKKPKAPKITSIDDIPPVLEDVPIDDLEPSTGKVKKAKKSKKSKTTTDVFNDGQVYDSNEYSTNPEFTTTDGAYGDTVGGEIPYDGAPSEYPPMEAGQERSSYETAIVEAYQDLASKINFANYVGNDQWCVLHLPKSARTEPKSRIRKMLPGGNSEKKPGATPNTQKGGFLNRIRSSMSTLVKDENNLIFGEQSPYDAFYDDDDEDGVDTDDLHRYAQKLRELEDADREVNPEFLILRDGKTDYAVHEADAEGKLTFSKRKPIYDRSHDQAPDDEPGKKNLFSRLRKPFARNKDKDSKGSQSPKSAIETPDQNGKRRKKKSHNRTTDDDFASMLNNEPLA